jgi:hypothetical protein
MSLPGECCRAVLVPPAAHEPPAERAQSIEARVQADARTDELRVLESGRHTGDEVKVSALGSERRVHALRILARRLRRS